MKKFLYAFSLLIIFGCLSSCEKDSSVISNDDSELELEDDCFFTNDCIGIGNGKSANELTSFTNAIITYYKNHTGKKVSLESSIGIPFWKYSVDWSNSVEEILYIPLVKKEKVNGFLIAYQNEEMSNPKFKAIKIANVTKLKKKGNEAGKLKYIDQEHAIITFLWFQKEIEGFLDCKLVNAYNKLQGKSKSDWKNCYWEYTSSWACHNEIDENGVTAVCGREWEYVVICDNHDDGGSGEDSGGGTGDSDSGDDDSGSSNTTDPDSDSDPEEEECDPGYVKDPNGACVEEETIVDNTTTPCVKDIIKKIKDSSFGSNLFVQVLRDVFDQNTNVSIIFTESNLSAGTDGEFNATVSDFQGTNFVNGTLTINSAYTSTATQDWVLATLIHEMIHGYITFQKNQVVSGNITQMEFDQMFPLYALGGSEPEHEAMGYQFLNAIADILIENNPLLSQDEAYSLSRVGLNATGFWLMHLSPQQRLDAINANDIGRGNASGASNQINC